MAAMHPLSAAELLDAASLCRDRASVEAGAWLAALARPDLSVEDCVHLPLGARDAAIGALHAAMFGPELALAAVCPHCAARLDVALTTDALAAGTGQSARVRIAGRLFGVRAADSDDLAAIADLPDADEARRWLAWRCLVPAEGEDWPETLTDAELERIAAALARIDPGSDPYVPLRCFDCGAEWDAPVDMARIFATELAAAADRLMDDIHDLAIAYHWTEAAILALAPSRRRAYLERLRG